MTLDTHIVASIEPDTEQVARHSMLRQRFEQQADLMPAQLASELGIAEMEVVAALPPEQVVFVPLTQLDTLLQMLPEWGNLTTIVMLSGSVFEFKGDFPQGKYAHGYYNLYSKGDGLHGHLKLDTMRGIALISRPFRGSESHSINFFGSEEEVVFKVYLGRDKQRALFPEQVQQFKALAARFVLSDLSSNA
ncbi:heme utilization cystosolic carrier protein HutX [Shewanella sp. JNE10-2]|uniref:heme utilization cystosolic carrier protein HutX n=1 Tax=unclassified Shewanella TaxID=196818 RepID=UPI002003ACFC|nr:MULTISPECIES: heme utilization cystosolic carrier protein HutX [unclassified Shewanella]MCK7629923.1 heme utilization cystosolic carrier protein HutX [Shewanella sp. JNE9-1]MCK7645093.1 heme utilization cystosolic carrier protein HutX [Shewanella sp. JNE3-1]MCK7653226.1 heme utilization cystosolic carrier protein HutX [Shewanella sp. JNE4-1]UPO29001.1 heme utilization cystosolic carrier protein HutX [Shewanella sp. JNE10-2]UPO36211.1 heme utilization cystosolic carrier protein HutX [Shewane